MILSFYSYKGGVGRSMAMANVAALFARAGVRVLVVDCDQEAPGIEAYLAAGDGEPARNASLDRLRGRPGLIDVLYEYKRRMGDRTWTGDTFPELGAYLSRSDGEAHVGPLTPGTITLLTAGDRNTHLPADESHPAGQQYIRWVNEFNWTEFYAAWAGAGFVELFRQRLNAIADVVFLDTRTGVTEVGGVCTHELADLVVALCAANEQNLTGTGQMASSLLRPELLAARTVDRTDPRLVEVLVVPARVEQWAGGPGYSAFARKFEAAFAHTAPERVRLRRGGLLDLAIPYVPHHATHERLSVPPPVEPGKHPPGDPPAVDQLVLAYHRLADTLFEWLIARLPPAAGSDRKPCKYFIEAAPEDLEWAAVLQTALEHDAIGFAPGSRVSLGLFDAVIDGREPPADALAWLRDELDPPLADRFEPPLLIQLVDADRDIPHRRWGPAESVRRATSTLPAASRQVIRVEIRSGPEPARRSADEPRVIRWASADEYRDVVDAIKRAYEPLRPRNVADVPDIDNRLQNLTDDAVASELKAVKKTLDWDNTTGSARKWWDAFEVENPTKMRLVLRLAMELEKRKATITEFFLAYVYSNTDNIQANLHYLDYTRLKKEEERKKRAQAAEALQKSLSTSPPPATPPGGEHE